MNIFNTHIEFTPEIFRKTIEEYIISKQKAYVCVVDASVISRVQTDMNFRNIVNNANINTCDGSSIAMLANKIYKTNYQAYNGPEIFEYYIERPYKHLLIGNTIEKVNQIKEKVKSKGLSINLAHIDVPFVPVEQFDYDSISKEINSIQPDIIWVSLGNPKQETFMNNIFPYIKSGVMFGIGAAFNFYTGDLHNNKSNIGGLRFIWLERLFSEPKKQWNRVWLYLKVLPKMYFEERKKYKKSKTK